MKFKDLSVWFGLKPDTFKNSRASAKAKRLKALEGYADYHFEGKKLYIDKVYIPEYCPAMAIAEEEFEKSWGLVIDKETKQANWQKEEMVDTCARVGRQIWYRHKELQKQVTLETFCNYVNRVKVKWYGHNYIDDHGEKGRSEKFYVKTALRQNEEGKIVKDVVPLTAEEKQIIKSCWRDAYLDFNEKSNEIEEAYRDNEISKKERDKLVGAINTDDCYDKYCELLIDRLKYSPDKWTKLIPERYFEKEK